MAVLESVKPNIRYLNLQIVVLLFWALFGSFVTVWNLRLLLLEISQHPVWYTSLLTLGTVAVACVNAHVWGETVETWKTRRRIKQQFAVSVDK